MSETADSHASAYYMGDRGASYHALKHGVNPTAFTWIARARARKFSAHIRPHYEVLEFGVGPGWNLAELDCKRKVGVDVADSLRPSLEAKGIEFASSLSEIPAESIDVVICHHVLEHLRDPAQSLLGIRRVLRSGGRLLLHVPYEHARRFRRYEPNDSDRHLHSWNVQTLGNLVCDMDFEVEDARLGPFGYDRFVSHWTSKAAFDHVAAEVVYRLGLRLIRVVKPVREVCLVARKRAP